MDFFERQAQAQRKTKLLIFYFVLAVIGIIVTLQVIFGLLLRDSLTDPGLLLRVSGGVIVVVVLGSTVKMIELSQGGRVVAAMLGGEPITATTTEPAERKLINVVEEMAIASGVPAPEIYILPDMTINAFAAGHGPGDTAIGVTRGCIEQLSRDELQGVIAHEFSHILHGDMKLNIRLIGLLNGILGLALIGSILMRSSLYVRSDSRSDRNGNSGGLAMAIVVGGVALYLVGWIGVFFGNLIKAAVSRQREFLADASAVQYTRNPSGIAGALKKIGGFDSKLASPRAAEASHLYFGNGVGDPWLSLFATHPPLAERIKAIDPSFVPSEIEPPPSLPAESGGAAEALSQFSGPVPLPLPPVTGASAFAEEAARDLHGAGVLVYAILLDPDATLREQQLTGLNADDFTRQQMLALFERLKEIPRSDWLPLVDLAIPTLRNLSPQQYADFRANVRHLVESDQQISLFEFALQKTLLRHLDLYFTRSTGTAVKFRTLDAVLPDAGTVLSALALVGSDDENKRNAAFVAGWRALSPQAANREKTTDLTRLDAALDRLAQASPDVKRSLLDACRAAALSDGVVVAEEYELLRAVANTIDCPLPPLLAAMT